ncbi:MAG: 3-demethylubiquinone-9 3-methyltransferase [Tardiphaga sp.]|jgi:predicted 3-demethylubiquinone-9 3-methyltransferase (glyoxalase superfamily)|nr:3-demethylubiquinone-9 3-methyltransferase [Tardiphaga sp.]MDB5546891.1 3-demethylubiquinone-9 3-methyltransferase [Tardiphaga sp.]MDB5627277.1 3-demethylubiquinone-9 3-methyltransferase [Tardiphaga sp.]MDB5630096.1 3-demethylubiquinone-9 3-methyltransferase [Tardiphaga sp.]
MSKITPCLWFATEAEAAANFYVSLLPNSRVTHVQRSPMDNPSGKAGSVLVVNFELAGQSYMALNGNQPNAFSQAVSFMVDCEDQAEVDRLWNALCEGGAPVQCGWLKDRYGVSWQIVPKVMLRLLGDPDPARAKRAMAAMMTMVKLDVAALEQAAAG